MEDSWRFRPIQGNNVCPTCSIYHFPFCPPPQPPSFQTPPYFDPMSNNRPIPRFFDDGFNSIRPVGAQGYQREPYQPLSRYDYGGNELRSGEFCESDRIVKRMRVSEMSLGSGSFSQTPPPSRFSIEDERRLSLIRQHGVPSVAPMAQIGVNSKLGMSSSYGSQVGNQLNGYSSDNSYGDWQPRQSSNSFYDSMGGSALHQEAVVQNIVYDDKKEIGRVEHTDGFRSDRDLMFYQNKEDTFYESSLQSYYGQKDKSINSSLQRYGPTNGLVETPSNFSTTRSDVEGSSALLKGERFQQPHISDHEPYSIQQESHNMYHGHGNGSRQPHANGLNQTYESQRSHLVNSPLSLGSGVSLHQKKPNFHIHEEQNDVRQSFEFRHAPVDDFRGSVAVHTSPVVESCGALKITQQGTYLPISADNSIASIKQVQGRTSQLTGVYPPRPPLPPPGALGVYPPLPPLPPPSLPMEPPGPPPAHLQAKTLPSTTPFTSSDMGLLLHPSAHEGQSFLLKNSSPEKPKVIDACTLFKQPGRDTRPDHIVIILRGLPDYAGQTGYEGAVLWAITSGDKEPRRSALCKFIITGQLDKVMSICQSEIRYLNYEFSEEKSIIWLTPYLETRHIAGSGKSYLAKMLRDLEVENGAKAPRIHSMDDYFMTEVEKVEEREVSKSSGLVKGKKRVTKKVIEYCYEPEMEEAYRSSMLKAFKKTLEEGIFTFIIVDDRNLRIADFAQFWASAKRSGYEVYLLEAMYKDPVGCAARNVHGFASDDIQKMVELWEEAPSLYLRLDIQSLLHGDDLKEHDIQEVDMDMDDAACDDDHSSSQNQNLLKAMEPSQDNHALDDRVKEDERWDGEEDDQGIKELGRSKWSHDADEDDIERSVRGAKGTSNALSGLIQAYTKGGKSVHWGDQVGKSGFSIGGSRMANVLSLVIGPGAGYNLKSNPLSEEEENKSGGWQSKSRSVFEEQLCAERASERESFKSVVDRRRQRIVGLEMEDE